MQSSDVRSNHIHRNDSQIEGGESGVGIQTFRETELTKPTRVYINDVSRESPLRVHRPGIIKATQIWVKSVEEENSSVAKEVGECIEGETRES